LGLLNIIEGSHLFDRPRSYLAMTKTIFVGLGITAVALGIIMSLSIANNQADALKSEVGLETSSTIFLSGDLTSPAGGAPFGGDVVGDYFIRVNENDVRILAEINDPPSSGMVYEGWLVDPDSDYKLSTGQFNEQNDMLFFAQEIVNPSIYNVLVITAEPIGDTDPSPTLPPVGAVPLGAPFGQ